VRWARGSLHEAVSFARQTSKLGCSFTEAAGVLPGNGLSNLPSGGLLSINMAVLPLAMCYAGLAEGTLTGRPPDASIQNISGLPQGLDGPDYGRLKLRKN
jgi:hypothetical protein